jgi:GntR family transcriptional regulator, arabinose operon transcriptional repressor
MEKSLISLDLRHGTSRPKHERLKEHFIDEMRSGRLKSGQLMPSEQYLMETLGVARATIRQAMAALESEKLICRKQGKGTYVEADVLRRLKRGQDIFALMVPETRGGFYPSLLYGFESAASAIRHQAIVCATESDIAKQADIILQLLDKEIGGIAIVPTSLVPTPEYQIHHIQKQGIPVVFCHRRVEGITAPLLAIPFYEMGRRAGEVLIDRGHSRVAYFTPHHAPSAELYQAGLRDALHTTGLELPDELVYTGPSRMPDRDSTFASLKRMISLPEPPTAIFSTNPMAEMIYLLALESGIRVPGDVSIIGTGSTWRESPLAQRITTVAIDEMAMGRQAVSLLHEMRNGTRPLNDNTEITMDVELLEAETLAVRSNGWSSAHINTLEPMMPSAS